MKRLYTLLAAVLLTASAFAQVPEKMSYQAVVRDAGNSLVTSQPVGMQISILQGSVSGTAVYVETHTPNTNINGLVSLEIGSGTTTDDFSTIDWSAGPYFIKTETDPTGGTTYTITGTSQLMSVPYALHAKTEKFYLGQDTLGGIVYYLYKDAIGSQQGLIVNKNESTASWQSISSLTNADRTEDGVYNTLLMTHSNAATYVSTLGAGWYLPAIDELEILYYSRFTTNKALRSGGFTLLSTTALYWSSTEANSTDAFDFDFTFAYSGFIDKNNTYSIRAIRAF
jgi:hypothetical protein